MNGGASLPLWVTVPGTVFLICGGLLTFIGALGLWRLPDFCARMHSTAMSYSLGTAFILVPSALVSSALLKRPILHEILIVMFIAITAAVSAMLLIRAAVYRTRVNAMRKQHHAETISTG